MKYNIIKALEILENTPKVLYALLENLSDAWLFCNEGEDTWSAFDILGHLIHGEKTDWLPRVHIILNTSENKPFEPFDRFAQFKLSQGKTVSEMLNEFKRLRLQNTKSLRGLNLTENQLNLKGLHPELGEVSLKELLACWVTHDLGHIAQISRVMAKQYKTEVGSWIEYIPILKV